MDIVHKAVFHLAAAGLLLNLAGLQAAAPVEPSLELILRQAPPDSIVTVLVRPALDVELTQLEADLIRSRASRGERHRRVVEALRRETERSQQNLRAWLKSRQSSGRVASWRGFWIANLIAVSADPETIRELSAQPDAAEVLENRKISLAGQEKIKQQAPAGKLSAVGGPELAQTGNVFNWALKNLNVRKLWQRGLTGRGLLVGNIDSGVDGTHPALAAKWRGANGATATESWYDPVAGRTFPYDDLYSGVLFTHGTKVMGCMVGQTGTDTVGVAVDAQWIAAKAFDGNGNPSQDRILDCMEWMADPDGDPATVSDVPDVLNMSFADNASLGCLQTYWSAVDNLKLLGTVPIFASGNYPDHGNKVGSPGNRPTYFAVSSVDSLNRRVSFSMPGPGACDPKVIKPDVMAPGYQIRSLRGYDGTALGYYDYASGSSFSAPLVAGVAALILQANPELTPDQVYTALRNSATDLGVAGPDTLYGWGAVNGDSAVALAGRPGRANLAITRIALQAGSDGVITPGEEVSVVLTVTNNGAAVNSVTASISSNSPDVAVKSSAASFGNLVTGAAAANSTPPFELTFGAQVPLKSIRTFKVSFTSGDSIFQNLSFALNVGEVPIPAVESYATHDVGRAWLTVTNFGMLGKEGDTGGGFVYPRINSASPDHLFHGALLVGNSAAAVSDVSYSANQSGDSVTNDRDFAAIAGGNLAVRQPGEYADQEITGAYNDSRASSPLGVQVDQRSYAWVGAQWDDFVIVEYTLERPEDSTLTGLYVGQLLDWDVGGSADNDLAAYESGPALAYMFDSPTASYVGHVLLTQRVSGFRPVNFRNEVEDGFTGAEKFSAMTVWPRDTVVTAAADWSEILAAGPIDLPHGRQVTVAFAVVGGVGLQELRANAAAARQMWAQIAAARGLDTKPPVIVFTPIANQHPNRGNYDVPCTASDSGGTVDEVSIFWRDEGLAAWSAVKASSGGLNGLFQGLLPKRSEGTRVQYFLRAIDEQGNQGFSPAESPAGYYSFLVGDTTRPRISGTSAVQSADSQGIEISAKVTDTNLDRVFAVLLRSGATADTLPLVQSDSSRFSALVMGLEAGTEISYYVAALDSAGNLATDPPGAPDSLFVFSYSPVLAGDGDLDGRIDIFDLLALLKVISGRATPSSRELAAMDLNGNGRVEIFDLIELLKLLTRK